LSRADRYRSKIDALLALQEALGIAVAIRCDGCAAIHAEAAVRQGATGDEVTETMGKAIYMGAGASVMYAVQAVEAFDEFAATKAPAA
jgi:AhpD family alkylhydroperoxidase